MSSDTPPEVLERERSAELTADFTVRIYSGPGHVEVVGNRSGRTASARFLGAGLQWVFALLRALRQAGAYDTNAEARALFDQLAAAHRRGECQPPLPEPGTFGACYDCGRRYGDVYGFPDLVLPNDLWAKISPSGDEGGLLCPSCICRRAHALGMSDVPAMWGSGPLVAVPYTPAAPSDREAQLSAVRALYLEGFQAGMEAAAEIGGYHAVMDAREREKAEVGRFFDEHCGADGDWPALARILDLLAELTS
jgi:hypothetical protein